MNKKTKTVCITCVIVLLLLPMMLVALTGCSEASRGNYNISKQADSFESLQRTDYFESLRRITVYNARTDKIILEAEGYMSLSNNTTNELVVTCKTGPNQYKKNYVYLNEYTMYAVEDISGTYTDPYHYKLYFHTNIVPDIDVRP